MTNVPSVPGSDHGRRLHHPDLRARPTHVRRSLARGERLLALSLHVNVLGLTVAVVGVGIAVSGIVDLIDGGPDVAALLVTGLVTGTRGLLW